MNRRMMRRVDRSRRERGIGDESHLTHIPSGLLVLGCGLMESRGPIPALGGASVLPVLPQQ